MKTLQTWNVVWCVVSLKMMTKNLNCGWSALSVPPGCMNLAAHRTTLSQPKMRTFCVPYVVVVFPKSLEGQLHWLLISLIFIWYSGNDLWIFIFVKIYCVYYCIIRTIRPRLVQYYKMQWRANKYEVTKDEHEVHGWGGRLLFIWTSKKFQSIRGMHKMSKQGVFNNTTYLERRQSGCTVDGWERTEWLLI